MGVGIVALLSWATATLATSLGLASGMAIAGVILALLGSAAWYGLGQLEQRFYHGRLVPPRNFPEQSKRAK